MLGFDNVNPYDANVLDALQGKAKALCEGLRSLELLMELLIGAYPSARDGRTVH